MTDCTHYADDLKAYADGELPVVRRAAVRRHLNRCPACREEIAAMTQLTEDLRASEPTDALDADLRARILDAPPVSSRLLPSRPRLLPSIKWALAGAVLLAWCFVFPALQKTRSGMPAPVSAGAAPILQNMRPSAPSKPQSFSASPPLAANPDAGQFTGEAADTFTRQVHKEATLTVQIANPETGSDSVETLVKEAGGFVASNTLNTSGDGLKSAALVVKVPVAQFETVLAQISKMGSVQAKNVTGEDITEQAVSAAAAENVLEGEVARSQARLKALGAKAQWGDQQSVRDLRIQLAQTRARLMIIKKMAVLSTITLTLEQAPKNAEAVPVTTGFWGGLKVTTHDAVQSLVGMVGSVLTLAIWLLAYAPLWIPALLLGRYGLKEYHKRQAV